MVVTMHARLGQQAMRHGRRLDSDEMFSDNNTLDFYDGNNAVDVNYRWDILILD